MATLMIPRASLSASTLVTDASVSEAETTSSQTQTKGKKRKQRKNNNQQKQADKSSYQVLGEELLASTQPPCQQHNFDTLAQWPSPSLLSIPKVCISDSDISRVSSYTPENQSDLARVHQCVSRSRSAFSVVTPRHSEDSGSTTLSGSTTFVEDQQIPDTKYRVKGPVFTLKDFRVVQETEEMVRLYGRTAHMGVRDPSYTFWINDSHTCVVHFKVLNKIAVLGGDPICRPSRLELSMKEFTSYCKKAGWKTAIISASENMTKIARKNRWTTMQFGNDVVLNPMTNEVLLGKSGKRITSQCRQLLDPARGGISVHTYVPAHGRDFALESELNNMYDEWRNERNTTRDTQAFVTVFDLFSMSSLMTFLYTTDKSGKVNGFAALRKLGPKHSYHIDPFIQSPDAPRGVSDLLIYASLAMLRAQGSTFLSLGFAPLAAVGEISGLPSALHQPTRKTYAHVFGKIPVGGKEAFFARWKPDLTQQDPQYLIFTTTIPSPRYMLAMTHFANVSLRRIIATDLKMMRAAWSRSRTAPKADTVPEVIVSDSSGEVESPNH